MLRHVLHLTAGAEATGEVTWYNCIVRLRSLPRFAETISQGYCFAANEACEAGIVVTACRPSGFSDVQR